MIGFVIANSLVQKQKQADILLSMKIWRENKTHRHEKKKSCQDTHHTHNTTNNVAKEQGPKKQVCGFSFISLVDLCFEKNIRYSIIYIQIFKDLN